MPLAKIKLTRHTVQPFPVMNAISFFISFSLNVIVIPCVSFIALESRSGEDAGRGLQSATPARDNLSGGNLMCPPSETAELTQPISSIDESATEKGFRSSLS